MGGPPPHYLERARAPVMLFHGEPTWCFLWRKVAAVLLAAGYRVIAPDYPGFGGSDKPVDPAFYSYDRHTAAMAAVVEHLGLEAAAAVVQDWGGPIGLRVAVEPASCFTRLAVLNTSLFDGPPSEGFLRGGPSPLAGKPAGGPGDAPFLGGPVPRRGRRRLRGALPRRLRPGRGAPLPPDRPHLLRRPGAGEMRVRPPWPPGNAPPWCSSPPRTRLDEVGRRFASAIPGAGPLETIDGAGHFLQRTGVRK